MEVVQGFGGVLVRCNPALLMVVFGLPQTLEQTPERAVQAALAIRHMVAQAQEEELGPDVRLAIHAGIIWVDAQARDPAERLLTVGDTLSLPLRLLGHATGGEVLVSPKLGTPLKGRFALKARELPLQERGAMGFVAYSVLGLKLRDPALESLDEVSRSPFVGRTREMAVLVELLRRAEEGRGQVVGLVGEPGIGKSRMLFEFRQYLMGRGVTYLEGHCLAYGGNMPYLPVLDLVRGDCGIAEADTPASITEKVHRKVQAVAMDPDAGVPYLLQLLGVKEGTDRLAVLTPEVIKARMFETLRQMIVNGSRQRPLVIAVENLHWIDKTSEDFFRSFADRLASVPILLLGTYRPGYRPRWLEKSYATQMVLSPVGPDDSLRVIHATLHGERLPDALIQRILDKAEGNPFFLEELTRAVVEQKDDGSHIAIPDTIQGVLMARIDTLPPAAKHLLQTAAVFGREVPLPLLLAVVELPEAAVLQALRRLQASELFSEKKISPVREYTFKHALTQEVAYASLPREQRRALHANIVGALERLHPDRLDEQIERLAHHAWQGEVWDKAVVYFRQAGTKALERSANHEAVACFERALVALKHLPDRREWQEQAIDLRFDLRRALLPLGEYERILECLGEAEVLAKSLGDQGRMGRVSSKMSMYHFWMGNQAEALSLGERALALATELGDFALQIEANEKLGMTYYGHGNYCRAIEFLRQNVTFLEGDRLRECFGLTDLPVLFSRSCLVWCLAELGKFAQGTIYGEEGIQIAEAVDQPSSLAMAYWGIGFLYLRKGDLSKAILQLEHGLEFCRVWNFPAWHSSISSALGYAYALSGHLAKALPLLNEAVEQAVRLKTLHRYALRIAWLSESHLLVGQLDEAVSLAQQALELSRKHHYRGQHAWALRLLGEIALHQDPSRVEEAEAFFRQAIALAEELKMCPLLSHCRLGLGTLYAKMGRMEQARVELTTALDLYRAMQMRLWLAQGEAMLVQIVGSESSEGSVGSHATLD